MPDLAGSLPNIAEFIEDREITIGRLRPVGCVATAAAEDRTYTRLGAAVEKACLSWLLRIDQAIDKGALTLGTFSDESNR